MLRISSKAHLVLFIVVSAFLIITGFVWVGLLGWMSLNNIDGGVALNKLETFVAGNFGLWIGTLLKSR